MSKTTTTKSNSRASQPAKGRRFTEEQKQAARALVATGVLPRASIAALMGTTAESIRRWLLEAEQHEEPAAEKASADEGAEVAEAASVAASRAPARSSTANGTRSPYAPKDPGQGLGAHEVAAIIELKQKHPSMGPAQLRAQLKRFKGWRLSNKAIARVLKQHGYQLVHGGGRPEGPEPVRFEAPRRNALWQADFTEVRVGSDKLHVLVILDDFSRFVVAHALCDGPSSEVATATLKAAIARHGLPEAVRTDRGGAFVASKEETDFARYLEAELIDHVVGHAYHPQGGGKVESAIGTLKRELWEVFEFHDRDEAARRLDAFFEDFNHRRAHMGIDGLTPADRFFGRADKVLAAVDAVSRQRQGALALLGRSGGALEEVGAHMGAPLEVLRLVLVDGAMELRFCGARVRLGPVEK
jgi:transposase InsO family protein/transposase-like protein